MFVPLTLYMCDRWGIMWSIHLLNLNVIGRSAASYWRLTIDFSSVLGGSQILLAVILKTRGPICTKLGGDIGRSLLHTQFNNGDNILLFSKSQRLKVERFWVIRPIIAHFDPRVKITGGVGGRAVWVDSSSCAYGRTSGMHLLNGLTAAAESRVPIKKE